MTVLIAVSKVTSSNLGYCSIRELKHYLSGITKRDCYKIVNKLYSLGYITHQQYKAGKQGKRIELTDNGRLLLKQLHRSLYNRIYNLNDRLKVRAKEVRSKLK